MRPTELRDGRRVAEELAVGAVVVAADDAGKRLAQKLPEHLGTAGGVDVIPGEAVRSRRMKAPRPQAAAALGMARLVDVEPALLRQRLPPLAADAAAPNAAAN